MTEIAAPETKNTVSAEELAETVTNATKIHALCGVVIQTHYGSVELPVTEVWVQDGVLKISVLGT